MNRLLAADAHVHFHLHPRFDEQRFLDAAEANLTRAAGNRPGPRLLLLAESAGTDWFARLTRNPTRSRWNLRPTGEPAALVASRPQRSPLTLVAGRQIATRERLEVLALATRASIADGLSLRETLDAVRETGGLPLLPWAFGKWSGRRAGLVREAIVQPRDRTLLVGDNGTRPWFVPRSSLFEVARAHGRVELPGSDPLPSRRHERRAGSFGFLLQIDDWDDESPIESLRGRLATAAADPPRPFGKPRGAFGFLRDQVELRLPNRDAG